MASRLKNPDIAAVTWIATMRKITVIAGLGLAAALALTGCTAGTNTGTDTSAPSASSEAHAVVDTVNSDGAGLRAALQAVL